MDIAKTAQALSPCVCRLCDWFEAGRRLLPWRIDPTPYHVWISEIMLQQTRIEAVIPYYERFIAQLPDVGALSRVDPERLMKLWEGLGYYSRARNLQKAAREIMDRHGGVIPADFAALKALSGIGEYTAGAIASIAFGVPVPAVDGNVLRVLARMTACDADVMKPTVRRELTALAQALVPRDRAAAFNQGLMELGERVCVPNTMPRCEQCPLSAFCAVAGMPEAATLPVRAKAKPRRIEERTVTVVLTNETPKRVLLHKRPSKGLLASLWELPNVLGHEPPALPLDTLTPVSEWAVLPDSRHIFSHIEWHMKGYVCVVAPCDVPDGYVFAPVTALADAYALPTAFGVYKQIAEGQL